MSKSVFSRKRSRFPILNWGFDISVAQCSIEDIRMVLGNSFANKKIKMISKAIEAAEWFSGIWYVGECGSIVRPIDHVSNGCGIEFKNVSINPVYPHSNVSGLAIFRNIQKGELKYSDETSTIVMLSTSMRVMVHSGGFYLREVRDGCDIDKTIFG